MGRSRACPPRATRRRARRRGPASAAAARSALGAVLAQHADHVAQLLQRGVGAVADDARRLRTSSAEASAWNSSAPACSDSSDRRWASTSCISPAIRRRSASRAWLTRSPARPRALGPVPQRQHQRVTGPRVQPPAEHDARMSRPRHERGTGSSCRRGRAAEMARVEAQERRPRPGSGREPRMATLKGPRAPAGRPCRHERRNPDDDPTAAGWRAPPAAPRATRRRARRSTASSQGAVHRPGGREDGALNPTASA